jgi:chromosome segregation ATPase
VPSLNLSRAQLQDTIDKQNKEFQEIVKTKASSDAFAEAAAKSVRELKGQMTAKDEQLAAAQQTQTKKQNELVHSHEVAMKALKEEAAAKENGIRDKANGIIDSLHDKVAKQERLVEAEVKARQALESRHAAEKEALQSKSEEAERAAALAIKTGAQHEKKLAEATEKTMKMTDQIISFEKGARLAQEQLKQYKLQISEVQEELDCSKKLKQGSESRLVQANEINAALIEQIKNIRENADKKDSADRVVARYHGEDARPREVVSAAVVATTTVTVTDGSA